MPEGMKPGMVRLGVGAGHARLGSKQVKGSSRTGRKKAQRGRRRGELAGRR